LVELSIPASCGMVITCDVEAAKKRLFFFYYEIL